MGNANTRVFYDSDSEEEFDGINVIDVPAPDPRLTRSCDEAQFISGRVPIVENPGSRQWATRSVINVPTPGTHGRPAAKPRSVMLHTTSGSRPISPTHQTIPMAGPTGTAVSATWLPENNSEAACEYDHPDVTQPLLATRPVGLTVTPDSIQCPVKQLSHALTQIRLAGEKARDHAMQYLTHVNVDEVKLYIASIEWAECALQIQVFRRKFPSNSDGLMLLRRRDDELRRDVESFI